jgi:hypothetical protein
LLKSGQNRLKIAFFTVISAVFCYFCENQLPIPIIFFFINRHSSKKITKNAQKPLKNTQFFSKNTQNRSIFSKIVSKRVFFSLFLLFFSIFSPETPPGALPDYGRIHDAGMRWIAALRAAGLEPVFVADGAGCEEGACRLRSGSGWVGVGPIDSWDQCGSNGTKYNVAVAVLAELWRFERTQEKYGEKNLVAGYHATYKVRAG